MSDALTPLRHPAFRHLATGRTITMLGNAIAPIALAFAVLDLTGSVAALGLVVGARSLMNVLFLLFGGVVADRFPRQRVMVTAGVLAAATQAAVAALVLSGSATVPLLAALAAVNGVVSAFAFPAAAALAPQTVPASILQQANALSRLGINAAMIAGASAGGLLVAVLGPGWGLAIDAATFALGAAFFARVKVVASGRQERRTGTLTELREGWTEFTARTWVWVVVLGFMLINAAFAAGVQVLGPAVADDTIGRRLWGLVLAVQTAGMVAGAVVSMRIRARRLLRFGVASMLGVPLLLIALAEAPMLAPLLVAALVCGLGMEQFGIAWETSVQRHVPADRLARVFSYDALGSFLAIPIGQVVVGPAALLIGRGPTLLAAAALVTLAVAGMLTSRDVRRLPTDPQQPPAATPSPATPNPPEPLALTPSA